MKLFEPELRICPVCGNGFLADQPRHTYCSVECRKINDHLRYELKKISDPDAFKRQYQRHKEYQTKYREEHKEKRSIYMKEWNKTRKPRRKTDA